MKTLIASAILLTLSGTAFAGAELPQDTIPGYGVQAGQAAVSGNIQGNLRAETLAYTIPGYGITSDNQLASNRTGFQSEIGSVEVDYLGMSFEGAH